MPESLPLLVVAATERELAAHPFWPQSHDHTDRTRIHPGTGIVFLRTDAGPGLAAAALGLHLGRHNVRGVLGLGIAGAFPDSGLRPGDLRSVIWESWGDLGAEDGEEHLDARQLGLPGLPADDRYALATAESMVRSLRPLPEVGGLTVSTCSGSPFTAGRRARMGAALETMEGAAWAHVCKLAGVPFAQVRAVSNQVGPRDRTSWQIHAALVALTRWLEDSLP